MTCDRQPEGHGGFLLSESTPLYHAGVAPSLVKAFKEFFLCFFDFELREVSSRTRGMLELVEHFGHFPKEGYTIEVAKKSGGSVLVMGVAASSRRVSLVHAFQTLRQLLPAAVFGGPSPRELLPLHVPSCRIRDFPRYEWRGLMLDVARNFFGVDTVKQLILLMSMHKFNMLHLHLTDDQGWRIEIRGRPELVSVGAVRDRSINPPEGSGNGEKMYNLSAYTTPQFFTQDNVRDLVAFAGFFEIQVVPEIDVPAHTAALVVAARSAGHDFGTVELHEGCADQQDNAPITKPPNCMGGTHGIFVPTKEAMDYIFDVVGQVADLFPSRYFHLGGDEADDFRDEVYSAEAVEALKTSLEIRTSAKLQGHIVDKLHEFLATRGKTSLAWDETHFGLDGYKPPEDMLAIWWRDWSGEAQWEDVQRLGKRVILAPSGKMYLDMYQVEPHSESAYPVQEGTVPLYSTYSAAELEAPGILGVQGCLWSEHFDKQEVLEYQLFPRGAAVAEVGWTSKARASNFSDFLARWRLHSGRLRSLGWRFSTSNYTGEPRG